MLQHESLTGSDVSFILLFTSEFAIKLHIKKKKKIIEEHMHK